jgi:hypothetical protein
MTGDMIRHRCETLSVVTRESSTSRTTLRLARETLRFERNRPQLTRSFQAFTEDDLRATIVIPPSLQQKLNQLSGPVPILTMTTGLPDLLQRVIKVTGLDTTDEIRSLDHQDSGDEPSGSFFGYPSKIRFPDVIDSNSPVVVLAVILRPGNQSVQLTGDIVVTTDDARMTLERIVREHIEQWTPAGSLWGGPIEHLDRSWLDHAGTGSG